MSQLFFEFDDLFINLNKEIIDDFELQSRLDTSRPSALPRKRSPAPTGGNYHLLPMYYSAPICKII